MHYAGKIIFLSQRIHFIMIQDGKIISFSCNSEYKNI
jgi:hypothetical protein